MEGTSTTTKAERPRLLEEQAKMPGIGDARMTSVLEERDDGTISMEFTVDYDAGSGFLAGVVDRLLLERSLHRDVKLSNENLKDLVESESRVAVG